MAGVRCSEKTKGAMQISMNNVAAIQLEFSQWLRALGYSLRSVEAYELHTCELLDYVQKSGGVIEEEVINNYIEHLQSRPNQRRSGGLSCNTLILKFRVTKLFLTYLALMKEWHVGLSLPELEGLENTRLPLSRKQIDQLYKVIDHSEDRLRD